MPISTKSSRRQTLRQGLAGLTLACLPLASWAQTDERVQGEIRKVDRENRKITIKHGDIKSLDMPAMTMVFQVKDPAMLDQVKVGEKVNFTADKINGAYTVTGFEPTQ